MDHHPVVSHEEWLAARKAFLCKEKDFTRARDALAAERRQLPWERVEKRYVFEGPDGEETLADLFGPCSQLVVYHFMFGPDWEEGCKSCSFLADHFAPAVVHLAQRDVTLVAVSRAPLDRLEAFKARMGWGFKWVSSLKNDFNSDYHVSFSEEELASGTVDYNYVRQAFPMGEAPGVSVFAKDGEGGVYHSYSSYARGLDPFITTYQYLDLVPKGRDEADLPFTMAWIRLHDSYET